MTLQVLRCVDWGDAREARAAGELILRWAPIGLADALELLSPAFTNPEARASPACLRGIPCITPALTCTSWRTALGSS